MALIVYFFCKKTQTHAAFHILLGICGEGGWDAQIMHYSNKRSQN